VVAQSVRHLPKVIVVDDGSSDQTAAKAQAAGAEVLRLWQPGGKGAALAAGWKRAAQLGFTWALNMDGDGQHSPADIPKFLEGRAEGEPMLVIGNRMHNYSVMPWLRRKVNRWMSARLSRRSGQELPDSQCGFRLLHLGCWQRMELDTRHFEVESELILASVRLGVPIRFVPVQVIYKRGRSKIRPFIDSMRWFLWFFQRRH
jgi:glycosyltransferase involved in cell wall biosynthesis